MHIENPEALKIWLTVVLEPLCDADPSALARYVLALLKKEKPQKELATCMAEQLDVFLGGETTQFLARLFEVIKSQEYIGSKLVATEVTQEIVTLPLIIKKESTPPLIAVSPKESIIKTEKVSPAANDVNMKTINKSKSQEPTSKLLLDAKAVLEPRKRRNSNRSRTRSRSNERLRRSRSRDRRPNEYGRDKNTRQYRNSSPPTSGGRRQGYDQHRKNERLSPKSYANRPNPGGRHRSKSQSRSRSNSPDYLRRGASPKHDNDATKRKRCRDFNEKGYCMRGETCPWDHGVDPVVLEDINNPAMLGMPARPPIHSEYNPDAPDLWNRGGPNYGPRMMHGQGMPMPVPRPPVGFGFRGPPFPFMGPGATAPLPRELIPVPVLDGGQGGDISNQVKRRFEPEDSVAIAEGPQKRKVLMNSRLGPRMGHNGQMMGPGIGQNCSLELRKVPRGLNAISHLNNHFSKFGKIVNIQISYDNDPEAAIVTFSAHAEANVAYRSTEAVLNNRFIKVFWHSGAGSENNNGNVGNGTIPSKGEMSLRNSRTYQNPYQTINNNTAQQADSANIVSSSSGVQQATTSESSDGATTAPATTHKPTTAASLANIQMSNLSKLKNAKLSRATSELIRKKQEEQVKTAVNLAHNLHKRKHDLLQEYLKQMRSALDLTERLDHTDPQRAKLVNTVKQLQVTIEKLRLEIEVEQAQIAAKIQTQTPARKTKEQQQKELLDVELELISQEQHGDGTDTAPIQKRLQELQRSLSRPNFPNPQVGTRPRPPQVRLAPPGSTSVDRRPTTILITGFVLEDSDALMGHFKHFGEITKNDMDLNVPSLTLTYANRIIAEQAISRGKQFKEKALNIIWYSPSVPADNNNETLKNENASPNKSSAPSDSEDIKMDLIDKKAELPLDEEDEEIESEDRSWRR